LDLEITKGMHAWCSADMALAPIALVTPWLTGGRYAQSSYVDPG